MICKVPPTQTVLWFCDFRGRFRNVCSERQCKSKWGKYVQSDLVEDIPARCREVGLNDLQRSLPTQSIFMILWFYEIHAKRVLPAKDYCYLGCHEEWQTEQAKARFTKDFLEERTGVMQRAWLKHPCPCYINLVLPWPRSSYSLLLCLVQQTMTCHPIRDILMEKNIFFPHLWRSRYLFHTIPQWFSELLEK